MKIYSWNVNGIRAVHKKQLFEPFIAEHQPDILCLQETKAARHQSQIDLPEYEEHWNSATKAGYSGTAIFTKPKPLKVEIGLPADIIKQHQVLDYDYGDPNQEGRVIAAEYDKFYVVSVYTPNAKNDLSRIPLRQAWDPAFLGYVKGLESGAIRLDATQGADEQRTEPYKQYGEGAAESATQRSAKSTSGAAGSAGRQASAANSAGKPVIFCGDLNVAHTEDDLARPRENRGKKGFTEEERAGFTAFIEAGFVDTFRLFHTGNGYYTWWTHWANARARNVGWRIDYILVSASLKPKVTAADIHPDIMGSDHCPVSVTIDA